MAARPTTVPPKSSRRRLRSLQQRCSGWIDRARYLLEEALQTAPADDAGYDAAALEDRILLSATPIVQAVTDGGLETAVEAPLTFAPETPAAVVQRRELVVIDPAAANYQQLVDDLESQDDRQLDVIVLDDQRDGIEQISEWLSEHNDVDAIHIVSHGEDGAVRLGSGWLNTDNLADYSAQLSAWGDSLDGNADLLLYGCDLAASESGRELLESLQALTGADVAASDDDTGHAQFGANWELEYSIGQIDTSVAFTTELQQTWEGKLASITVSTTDDVNDGDTSSVANLLMNKGTDNAISLREAILAINADSGGDTIYLGAGTYLLSAGADDLLGDLDVRKSVTIIGDNSASTIIDGGGTDRVFEIHAGTTNLQALTIQNGNAGGGRGGALNLNSGAAADLTNVNVKDSQASDGGGIASTGALTLTDVTVDGNTGIWGAGIYLEGGSATINRTTISNNISSNNGGGLYNFAVAGVSLTNATISGNSSTGNSGGGIWTNRVLTATNVTIANNQSASGGAGIQSVGSGNVTLTNSILDNPAGSNSSKALTSGGNNIDSDGTAGLGDPLDGFDPLLGSLRDNGGATWTHALLEGSSAINTGDSATAPTTDQRGVSRLDQADIGAYEYRPEMTPTGEFRVNTATGNTQETSLEGRGSHQAVAMAANGDYVVVWSSLAQDGSGWGVYGQLFDKDGVARGSELHISEATTTDDQKWATVGMDASGNFVVAWTRDDGTGGNDIYARRYDRDGVAQAVEFRVNDTATRDRTSPSIAVASDGQFVIAWKGEELLGNKDIYARRFNAAGAALDGSDILVEGGLTADYDPVVAINDSGEFAVLWDDPGGVKVQRFNANGTTNGSQITVDGSGNAGNGSLAMHSDGSLVVAWREGLAGSRSVYVKRFDNSGTAEGPATTVSTSTAGEQTDPSISMDSDGNYVVVWEGTGDQPGQSDMSGVFGQKFDATGAKVGDEFRINQSISGTQHLTSAAMLNIDNFVVVWSGNGDQTGQTDSSGVFARQYGTLIANQTPTANPGGPYTINEGEGLVLSGAGSSDPDGDTLTYRWDLDNDGLFGEVGEPSGIGATVSWATLQSFGIDDNGVYTIGVQVDDGNGGTHSATTTLTVDEVAPVLNVSGGATGTEDTVYSLTLSTTDDGDDTVTQWTVDWGDGTTTTHNFAAGTATHTYTVGGNFSILVAATDEDGTHVQRDLLVAASVIGQDDVYRFDAATGELVSTLDSTGGVLQKPTQALVGPNGDIYVTGFDSDNVVRYDSAGNYLGEFVTSGSGGLDGACGMAFDADGNLYVASFYSNKVLRYDASGNFVDVFGSGGGGMNGPSGIIFGPDGDLYVTSWTNSKVYKYDGTSGGSPSVVVANGLSNPDQLVFDTNGDLLIANGPNNTIKKFDGSLSTFASGTNNATGIALSPEGILYVSNRNSDSITMYDATSGASLGTLVASGTGGLSNPYHINWIPDHQVQVAHVADTPTVTGSTTLQNTQTTTGLVISRNSADTTAVTHFKITNISDGVLYLNDGSTQINNGNFVTAAQGAAGLKFTPSGGFTGTASFDVQASLAGNDTGLGGGTATANITVTANAPATVSLDNVVSLINENTSTAGGLKVANILITDDGLGINTLALSGADAAAFEIDGLELKLKSSVTLDYETKSSYDVTVTVDDASIGGTPDDTVAVTINLQDVNEFGVGVISDSNATIDAVDEDATIGTAVGITALAVDSDATNNVISYTLTNDADGRFTINSTTGVVTVAGVLDAEDEDEHAIVVRAFSSDTSFKTKAFTIAINDTNESSVGPISDANAATNSVSEGATVGTDVGITASATDADVTNNTVSYSLDDDAGGRFTINGTSGVVTVNGTLDAETATSHNIVVRATSSDTSTTTRSFTINVNDVNEASVSGIVDADGGANAVAENAATGAAVGITAAASDADVTNNTVSYSLDDDASGRFTIHSTTGVVTVNGTLDAETATSHTIVVRATSSDTSTTVQSFTVAVSNVNDNLPVFTSSDTASIDENLNAVLTLSATDADVPAQTITFVLSGGDDVSRFTIDGSNQLVFLATPDFEAPSDSNADNVYEVEVTSNDGAGGSTTQTITVTVTDGNEVPSISAVPDQTLNEDQSSGPLAFTIGDFETAASGLLVTASSSNTAVVDNTGITLGGSGANRTITIEPVANQAGSSVITLTVSDGTLTTDTSFVVQFLSVNDAPTIQPIGDQSTFEDQPTTVPITVGDVDHPAGSLVVSASSDTPSLITNGSLVLTGSGANRTLSFQPVANQFGSATITVNVNDGALVTSQSFVVVVQSVNDAPTASLAAASLTTVEDTPASVSVLPWFEDIDDAVLNYQVLSTDPSQLTARMVGDQLQLQPRADWHGTTTVRVKAIDAAGDFVIRNVSVTVTSVNDAPVGRTDRIVVLDGSATFLASDLMANDTDVDGDTLTLQIVSPPDSGTLIDLGGGRFEFQADGNADSYMTYRLFDGSVYSDPITVRFHVPPIPATPAALPPTYEAPAESFTEPNQPSQETASDEPNSEPKADKPAGTAIPVIPTAPPATVRPGAIDAAVGLPAGLQNQSQGFTWSLRTESLVDVVAEATERVLGEDVGTNSREEIKAAYATAAAQIRDAITQPQMWQAIHSMQDQIDSSVSTTTLTIGATVTATTSITVGYVVWVIRGGILLSSVMANLPMWRLMDPMAILNAVDGAEEDDESLESMVDERPPAEPVGADE